MLARTFLTAKDLGITDIQRDALITTLGMLERGELKHTQGRDMPGFPDVCLPNGTAGFTGHFNMSYWMYQIGCGTIACLGGTSAMVAGDEYLWGDCHVEDDAPEGPLERLFMPGGPNHIYKWENITTDKAAVALSNYLTTGEAQWGEVLQEQA